MSVDRHLKAPKIRNGIKNHWRVLLASTGLSLAGLIGHPHQAQAYQFQTNSDWQINWDTTLEYALGIRTRDANPELINGTGNINGDDGDRNFRHAGDIWTDQFNFLTQFDATFNNYGFHTSANGVYDLAYQDDNDNNSPSTLNYVGPSNRFSGATQRAIGQNVQLLDAFVHGTWQLGQEQRLTIKLGRQPIIWGESLIQTDNTIAAIQSPSNLIKQSSTPDAKPQDVVMPVNQAVFFLQPARNWSVEGYYQLEWRPSELPPSGSFFEPSDMVGAGGYRFFLGSTAFALPRANDRGNRDGEGHYGIRVSTKIGDTEYGLIYLETSQPTPNLTVAPDFSSYWEYWPKAIKVYGATVSTLLGDWSNDTQVGSELDVRRNSPLAQSGESVFAGQYATGDTLHWDTSFEYVADATPPIFPGGFSVVGQLDLERLLETTYNPTVTNGAGTGTLFNPHDATRNYGQYETSFNTTYYQVWPGVDLFPGVFLGYDFMGHDPTALGNSGSQVGNATIQLSLGAELHKTWHASIAYTKFVGKAQNDPTGDRDNIQLEVDRSF